MAVPYDREDDVFAPGGHIREELFTDEAIYALARCLDYASSTKWDSVRSPHVFMGLLDCGDPGVQQWAERLGADVPRLIEQFEELFLHEHGDDEPLLRLHREFFSDNVIRLLRDATVRATDHQRDTVTALDILITLFTTPNSIVAECFERIGVTAARLTELAVLAEQTVRSI
jgi:ATP-dependent Clp protease ATP-binding subunit ClpA